MTNRQIVSETEAKEKACPFAREFGAYAGENGMPCLGEGCMAWVNTVGRWTEEHHINQYEAPEEVSEPYTISMPKQRSKDAIRVEAKQQAEKGLIPYAEAVRKMGFTLLHLKPADTPSMLYGTPLHWVKGHVRHGYCGR